LLFLGLASPCAEAPVLRSSSPAEDGSEGQVAPSTGKADRDFPHARFARREIAAKNARHTGEYAFMRG